MRLGILGWLKSGAPLEEGIRLFALYAGEDHPFLKLISHNHTVCYPILINELCRRAGVSPQELNTKTKFRDDWPFLSQSDCPPELKILASNKITAYHNYVRAHELLFDCNNQEEQFSTVKNLVENYIENREVIREFVYYKEHGHCLGKHRIFRELEGLKMLRKLSVVDLIKMEEKLIHNIWRTQNELDSRKKPHLQVDREIRLEIKKRQLNEVKKLISAYS